MTTQGPVRTAVVGCGYWGKNLVRNFADLSDLRVCVDNDEGVRARIAEEYPGVNVVPELEMALGDPGIEAVVIATPASTHAELAMAALDAGKHTFVEKPLALTVTDAERMQQLAESSDRVLMVGHLMEYHPAIGYLKELVDSGELGEVYYTYNHRVNLGKVRSDENALWSLAPHDISMVLYLMGEEPDQVEATGQAFLQPGIEDVVFVTLRFGSGRVAHIHVSWLDPHKERRMTVVGSRKMAVFDDMEPGHKVRIYDKGVDRNHSEAAEYGSYTELLTLRNGDITLPWIENPEPLKLECGAFLDAVRTGTPPLSDGRDGLAVVRVLEAADRALRAQAMAFGPVR